MVNLPGSAGGVSDGVRVLAGVVGHAVAQIRGADDHSHVDPGRVDPGRVDPGRVDPGRAGRGPGGPG